MRRGARATGDPVTADTADWLRDEALAPVWAVARERLERNGVQPSGTVTVAGLDRPGRHALSGLLGRPVLRDRVRVDLSALDAVLRERSGVGGLVRVLETLGGPVRNRAAERSSSAAAREAPYVAARAWLAAHPEMAAAPWVDEWLRGIRRSGALTRLEGSLAATQLVRALDVAAGLTAGTAAGPVARTELAARSAGDAHALDDGSALGVLVVRALAAASGEPVPATASARRDLWERYGVSADAVSSTCLVLGVRPGGSTPVARRLRGAADAGDPVHLTAWDLARDDLKVTPATPVLVCENPRVLEAMAEAYGGTVPVVCSAGMPGLVAMEVLRRLAASGATLRYHGDFDWPGVAITNRLVAQAGVRPWRMTAADYLAAVRPDGPPLVGLPVEATWDPGLAAAMRRRGVVVHEEAVLDSLVGQARCLS